MKMQRRLAVFAALSLTGVIAAAAAPAQATAHKAAGQTQIVTTSSYSPIPAHRTLAQVKADPSATVYNQATGTTTSLAGGQAVHPDTGTPSGYTLVEQSKSDYNYMSKPYYMDVEFCNSDGCAQQAEVYAQVKQYVTGGSSKNWDLTQLASTIALENPAITWFYTFAYYCGINVSGGADHICENGASPSGVETGFNPGDRVSKRFETINSGTDFPMVAIVVHWSTGGTGTGKFREWDTCNSAGSTKLCSSTGTGS